jgi:hypothetical protein
MQNYTTKDIHWLKAVLSAKTGHFLFIGGECNYKASPSKRIPIYWINTNNWALYENGPIHKNGWRLVANNMHILYADVNEIKSIMGR